MSYATIENNFRTKHKLNKYCGLGSDKGFAFRYFLNFFSRPEGISKMLRKILDATVMKWLRSFPHQGSHQPSRVDLLSLFWLIRNRYKYTDKQTDK